MTTITTTEYAVQIEIEPGVWTFVMDQTGDAIRTLGSRAEATKARKIWDRDHSRVVKRQILPVPTPWSVV